jgi:parallel beta-helix repeat protein
MKIIVSGTMLILLLMAMFSLSSNIKPTKAEWTGTVYIRADGRIDPPDAPIKNLNGIYIFTSYIFGSLVVQRDNIVIDGTGYFLRGGDGGRGVDITRRSNVTVKNIEVAFFSYGFYIDGSVGINIYGCDISQNSEYAIVLKDSSYNGIYNNPIYTCGTGVYLENAFNNNIAGNHIANCGDGISLICSSKNQILGNYIANKWTGIYLESSFNNSITENEINHNYKGIWLVHSSNNTIYHNNFLRNELMQACLEESQNKWDNGYPSGGNYWSDYTGFDYYSGPNQDQPGSDGIGDTPYTFFDLFIIDYYPLINPHVPRMYNLTIVSNMGGSTSPIPGTYSYVNYTVAFVTAIPVIGYTFGYWLLDAVKEMENPISILVDSNHTLEAYFIDNIPPEISDPWQDPPANNVQLLQNVTVWINVTDYGTGIKNVTLWYSINNGAEWTIINMTALPIPSDTWITYEATIQGYENCTWVTYKIVAYDKAGNNATKDNNGYGYQYHVIPEIPSTITLIVFILTATILVVLTRNRRLKYRFNHRQ